MQCIYIENHLGIYIYPPEKSAYIHIYARKIVCIYTLTSAFSRFFDYYRERKWTRKSRKNLLFTEKITYFVKFSPAARFGIGPSLHAQKYSRCRRTITLLNDMYFQNYIFILEDRHFSSIRVYSRFRFQCFATV